VPSLGYGLEESALDAASRSLFRPAEQNGEPVATRTTITFTFGDGGTAQR
jgi:protein TonB